ncbi:methyltransferase domain-containing protein [Motilimonas cestriensis]|uniref:Methyltransferase domain-containing protein n=1 Tax=Motilimonas cestriensis TaxID=2742685 RepID=A0ABS8WBA3_9GAMM|nr:class I SAM-dependent methyltransferase [Motilimonas cestriensis]MCE2595577.1 methyltransferase domain-containing protein [Motilimonas cestriensis]
MKKINLPLNPNSPELDQQIRQEGEFLLKSFGSFGFVRNSLFDKTLISYEENYQNDQSSSIFFQQHMHEVYNIIKSARPEGSILFEVGCGKGTFLEIVKQDNYFIYHGVDASYEGSDPNIEKRYLTSKDRFYADIIVLRHTLEHIESPYSFLLLLKNVFNSSALIFIEVPLFDWIEDNKVLFDFTYEHVNYFSKKSLLSLFTNTISHGSFFGGQYQYCLANLNSINDREWCDFHKEDRWKPYFMSQFTSSFKESIKKIKDEDRIWIWGAATKGVLFLKHLSELSPSTFSNIVGVIDSNPSKQNKYTPSTLLMINSPEYFYQNCKHNDTVLVMNPNYLEEITNSIKEGTIHSIYIEKI